MKAWILSALIYISLGLPHAVATVEVITTDNYSEIIKSIHIKATPFQTKEVLLAFDIDETLLVVEDCLRPGKSSGFMGWLTMVRKCPAHLTEGKLDDLLSSLQQQGFATLALTARADNLLKATERELDRNELNFLNKPFGTDANFEFPFTKKSSVVFKDGVTYSSGKNKGEVLKLLLEKLPNQYSEVAFIDDGIRNVRAMKKAFEKDPLVHVTIYHYTRYNE